MIKSITEYFVFLNNTSRMNLNLSALIKSEREISRTHYEEKRFGKFNAHKTYRRKVSQTETACNKDG